jgi:carboxypeptidase Q
MKPAKIIAVICGLSLVLVASARPQERVNSDALAKIKSEAARQSQLMEVARNITTVSGPRITNSPNARAAGEYARKKLVEWKLDDVHLETWNFGNGWTSDRFSMTLASDPNLSLLAYSKPWTPGTNGPVTAEVVEAAVRTEADFARLRGKLKGKFALILPGPSGPPPPSNAATVTAKRFTDVELQKLAAGPAAPPVAPAASATPAPQRASATTPAPEQEAGFFAWVENALSAAPAQPTGVAPRPANNAATPALTRERVTRFFLDEGVAAMIEPGGYREGLIFLSVTATGETNPWKSDPKTPKVPLQIVLSPDQYYNLMQMVTKNPDAAMPVMMTIDVRNTYHTADPLAFNVVADIKGTDKADEFVELGAHLDSWHLSTGATDNGAGVAVVMEAMRILKAAGLPMRRTVRLGLWTGEEEGLLGSRAFVDKYFLNRPIMQTKAGHSKLSAYFNLDNGTGLIRGIYMQGNKEIAPIFESWMAPFKSMGMTALAPGSVGGTDHLSFDNIGLPAFQFIQDPIEYDTKTHHTNLDTYDRLLDDDLVKDATIVASFAYLTATRDELLPRKPLPTNVHPAGSPVP